MISVKTGKMFESGKKYSMELLISLYPDYCKMVHSLETPSLVLINGCEGKREWLCDTTKVTQSETSKGGLSLGMNGYGPGCESRLWHMKAIVPTSLRFSTFVRKVLKGELSIQDDFADFRTWMKNELEGPPKTKKRKTKKRKKSKPPTPVLSPPAKDPDSGSEPEDQDSDDDDDDDDMGRAPSAALSKEEKQLEQEVRKAEKLRANHGLSVLQATMSVGKCDLELLEGLKQTMLTELLSVGGIVSIRLDRKKLTGLVLRRDPAIQTITEFCERHQTEIETTGTVHKNTNKDATHRPNRVDRDRATPQSRRVADQELVSLSYKNKWLRIHAKPVANKPNFSGTSNGCHEAGGPSSWRRRGCPITQLLQQHCARHVCNETNHQDGKPP